MRAPSPTARPLTSGKAYAVLLERAARAGALLVVLLGAAVILGWLLNVASLKSVLPGLATMKVNTAIGFVAAGVSLWLLHTGAPGSRSFLLGRCIAIVAAVLGGLTLAEDAFGLNLGIDQFIMRDDFMAIDMPNPGRMSPATAFNFLFVGFALLSLKARHYGVAVCAHWLVVPPLFIATLAVVGYTYGVNSLYHVYFFSSMALHTAVAFFVIVVSILVANVRFGFARIATSDTMGGLLSRWLLPTIPCMLFTLGWLRLKGEQARLYDFQFGVAVMVLMSIVVCVIAVAWTAIILHRIDIRRQTGEAEIRDLNAGLEQRVRERTEELGKLSQELSAANKALERLSQEDGLTGLANRRHFDNYLNSQIAIVRRYRRPLALVLCDIDAFKAFNDNYGHPAGDECLKKIAAALQTCCRRPSDMIARYGGEEFAIVLPDTDLAGAGRIAETARDAVAQLNVPHAHSPAAAYVSISGGVAVALRDAENAEQLIAVADKALYDAKHQGRNRMVRAQVEVANLPREGKAFRGKS